ncbi:MAG TPA: apolipoprotein N-acyltransferase [Crenotrichaceae bacterium]|nr:apolipoprotein N-acyltransferase [Crenotrichaceae bacterium]
MQITSEWSRVRRHSVLARNPLLLDGLSLISGYLMVLGFAPYNIWLLTIVCFGVFFFCISQPYCSQSRAVMRGYLFGLGMFCFETSWVYISLHHYGGASVLAGIGLSGLAAAFYALFPMLAAFLMVALFPARSVWLLTLVWPSIWILVEWLRAWFVFGFPWLQLGSSLLDSPLAGYMPLIGGYGSGWLAAASAGLVVGFIQYRCKHENTKIESSKISFVILILLVIWGLGIALKLVDWTTPRGKPFTVALLQGNTAQEQKWNPEQRAKIIQKYLRLTGDNWDADLIVWPESAVPAYFHKMQDFYNQLAELGQQHHTDLLIGTLSADADTKRYYNTVVIPGNPPQLYRKRHLVPFGEYLPFQPVSGWIAQFLSMPMSGFSAGQKDQPLLHAAGMPLVATICYEDSYPSENLSGLPEAAYIVNVSNDAWFADSIAPHQHLQHARMRSLETGRYTLRATNNGITAIIDPSGRVIKQLPQFIPAVLKARVQGMKSATPYVRIGDTPVLLSLFVLIVVYLFWSMRRKSGGLSNQSLAQH